MTADEGIARRKGRRPQTAEIEIALSEPEAASLQHATATLRWFLAKTRHGWSHAALDPEECTGALERLEAIYYDAREQLKTSGFATLRVTDNDASLLRKLIALLQAIEPDAFTELVRDCRQLAVAIERPNRPPHLRGRRSSLAQP
jgi:hypothetical protein